MIYATTLFGWFFLVLAMAFYILGGLGNLTISLLLNGIAMGFFMASIIKFIEHKKLIKNKAVL